MTLAGMAGAQAYSTYRFTFDRVYGPTADQDEVYEHSAKRTVLSTLQVHTLALPHDQSVQGSISARRVSAMALCLCNIRVHAGHMWSHRHA